ncbi:hypothetical protein AMAG_07124 [Allomyces macrogynus ATCC 38327]|uniref:Uncharacterized protein n=1 Tax=Allomyces macrogynus (strain ATCC 38327) TaxID=578462 RepID=A0A0L0SHI8_ALLM3|nr:hypothetical protein AMAG_07124 [Allomyces macrogynus ATCC 38327]|eukprot:KNE61850.1 hypothetical protein AMAG_07124 [Allomyces macrogynus ATCC 38327]
MAVRVKRKVPAKPAPTSPRPKRAAAQKTTASVTAPTRSLTPARKKPAARKKAAATTTTPPTPKGKSSAASTTTPKSKPASPKGTKRGTVATPPKRAAAAKGKKTGSLAAAFKPRRVKFAPGRPQILPVYSKDEYDRSVGADEWWIQFEHNQCSHAETVDVYWQLDVYKLYELVPHMPAEACASVRFDILKTPADRDRLVRGKTQAEASQMTLVEIQDYLDDNLLEFDATARAFMPTIQTYIDALLALFQPHEDVYLAMLGLDDAATADADEGAGQTGGPPGSGCYFDVVKVFGMYAALNADVGKPPPALAKLYGVHDQLPLLESHAHTLVRQFFVRRSQPVDEVVVDRLLRLMIVAVGTRVTPRRTAKKRKAGAVVVVAAGPKSEGAEENAGAAAVGAAATADASVSRPAKRQKKAVAGKTTKSKSSGDAAAVPPAPARPATPSPPRTRPQTRSRARSGSS